MGDIFLNVFLREKVVVNKIEELGFEFLWKYVVKEIVKIMLYKFSVIELYKILKLYSWYKMMLLRCLKLFFIFYF